MTSSSYCQQNKQKRQEDNKKDMYLGVKIWLDSTVLKKKGKYLENKKDKEEKNNLVQLQGIKMLLK